MQQRYSLSGFASGAQVNLVEVQYVHPRWQTSGHQARKDVGEDGIHQ